jgi:hypothetical protein
MAKCANCGKKGFLLVVNVDSLCEECARPKPKDFTDMVKGTLDGFWEIPFGTEYSAWEEMVKAKSSSIGKREYLGYYGCFCRLDWRKVRVPDWGGDVLFAGRKADLEFYFINNKLYKGTVKLMQSKKMVDGHYVFQNGFFVFQDDSPGLFSDLYKKYSNPSGDKKTPDLYHVDSYTYVNSYTWKFENGSYIKFSRHDYNVGLKPDGSFYWETEYVDGPLSVQAEEVEREMKAEYEAKQQAQKAKDVERLTTEL